MLTDNKYTFQWNDIGNIDEGRPNLGNLTNVTIYRLMQYSMRSILNNRYGSEEARKLLFKAGELAGKEFCKNMLNCDLDFYAFISQLQDILLEQKIGILRFEKTNLETMNFTLVVAEDLDCSGLPMTDETVCDYDEGFIAGIFHIYTHQDFNVNEVDCWSKGDRVCRFEVSLRI
jgi:uncharacterized protein